MTQPFSIREALVFGWHKTKAHSGVLFQAMLALFALQIAGSIIDKVLHGTLEGFFAAIVIGVTSIIVGAGFTVIVLKLARGETATYRHLIPETRLVWRYFLASLLSGLLILGGLLLFVVPGVYLLVRFGMVRFAAIDGADALESLSRSGALTQGVKWRLLGFMLALLGLNLLGMLALMVGLLVTIPVSAVAYAHVYDALKRRAA